MASVSSVGLILVCGGFRWHGRLVEEPFWVRVVGRGQDDGALLTHGTCVSVVDVGGRVKSQAAVGRKKKRTAWPVAHRAFVTHTRGGLGGAVAAGGGARYR